MLKSDERIRYERQLLIESWDTDTQLRLKESEVFVAGAGGLGSPVLLYLALAGIGRLTICDFDTVSLSNLNRQILHAEKDIGVKKVLSAQETLNRANRHVTLNPIPEKLTKQNAERLIGTVDLIIDCLDNFTTRHILNEYSVRRGIPMIHAGISEFHGQLAFFHPPKTACLSCFYPFKPKKETVPVVGATAGVIGSLQALEAIKYLTGIGEPLMNKLLFWDGRDMSFDVITLQRNEACKVCGSLLPPKEQEG